jgi:nitroimidazol reductase NimA-like FMN-containing flavoprotein (pyridoxamine 5'-phosphate oxidase superfamily)
MIKEADGVIHIDDLRVLAKDECYDRLYDHEFGRLAIVSDGVPLIFPMNYVFDEPSIILRTREGTKLHASPMTTVAFEIDGIGSAGEWGWSVVATGVMYDVTETHDRYSGEVRGVHVPAWTPGDKSCVLRISIENVTGRAFGERGRVRVLQ